jgi:GEVED domain/Secretion system C-terminal sorting domain/Fibronectin type III domain/Pregnancy-associated plasma protein-A
MKLEKISTAILLFMSVLGYAQVQNIQAIETESHLLPAFASHSCGTPSKTEEQIRYTLDVVDQMAVNRNAGMTAVPIRVHIVRMNDGSGGISLGDVNIGLSYLNYFFKNISAEFFIHNVNYINSTTWYDFEEAEEAAMTTAHTVDDAINIYFVNAITTASGAACGYAYYPFNSDQTINVLMDKDCTVGYENGTLVHELGHFFDLAHTHDNTEFGNTDPDAENVPRAGMNANCSTKGDLLCDTEADPNGSNTGACVFVNDGVSSTDINGVTYTPDLSNIMSYYSDYCGGGFTAGQYTRMINGFATRLAHTAYNLDGAVPATVNDPSALTATANNSYGIDLSWTDNAGNETGYLIERSSDGGTNWTAVSGGGVDANVTSYTDEAISANNTYTYRVKASNDNINHYNTSSDVSVGLLYCVPDHQSNSCTVGGAFGVAMYEFLLETTTGTDLIDNNDNGCNGALSVFSNTYSAAVTAGTTYNFEAIFLKPGQGSYYSQYLTIWADLNQDGDFQDSGEMLYQANSAGGPTVTGSIAIPGTATNGQTTLRLRSGWSGGGVISNSCGYHAFGETEDYGLNVSGGLPVELISFSGKKVGEEIGLYWTTASEENNDYFVVERSANGRDFEFLAREKGQGTYSSMVNYELMDRQPLPGTNYYRLIQFDVDGTEHVQNQMVVVDFGESQKMAIFPNPTNSEVVQLYYTSSRQDEVQVEIFDLNGRILHKQQYPAERGDNQFTIAIPDYPVGVYVLKLYRAEDVQSLRFVKGN